MDYKTCAIIHRKDKEICIFLKEGEFLSYENIVDVVVCDQPERSKREDSEYGAKCSFGILKSEMRCSEHDRNAVREVQ